ncbi:MAG: YfiR family protein [Verrucomicrobia bacterium]|nr:YfiR family protein [Verrucomicrobiota bacterium]
MPRRVAIYLLLGLFLVCEAGEAETLSRYHVKAAFLYNFLKFVDWPPQTLPQNSPYVVGVLGEDPFGAVLDSTMQGKVINGRRIIVVRVTEQNMQQCHLLFICSSERRRYREIHAKLQFAPVLTVGETEEFAENGGAIEFYMEGNKVRFEINPEAAKRSNLRIDATLLDLARIVRTR